jgi:hypothetical protein
MFNHKGGESMSSDQTKREKVSLAEQLEGVLTAIEFGASCLSEDLGQDNPEHMPATEAASFVRRLGSLGDELGRLRTEMRDACTAAEIARRAADLAGKQRAERKASLDALCQNEPPIEPGPGA